MRGPHFAIARQRGQAMLEFAIVGVIFFTLVLGAVDVGRAVWNYNTLANATREGARYAIVHGADSADPSGPGSDYFTPPSDDAKVAERVGEFAGGLSSTRLTVETEWLDGTNEAGSRVKVTSRYAYEPIFGFFDLASFTISSSSMMEITH